MVKTSYPLASSKIITPQQWSALARNWLATGIIKGFLNEMQAYADSTGMKVKVKSGAANLLAHYFSSDTEEVLSIAAASSANPRIDRVIIRLDYLADTLDFMVLQGIPAASPAVPALTQNATRWEISLAQVLVGKSVATIAAGNISDERSLVQNANAIQEAWTNVTTQNGWSLDPTNPCQYSKDSFGIVRFRGVLIPGILTNGVVPFLMPGGYRPVKDYNTIVKMVTPTSTLSYTTFKAVSSGNCSIWDNMGISWVSLDGVQYRTDS